MGREKRVRTPKKENDFPLFICLHVIWLHWDTLSLSLLETNEPKSETSTEFYAFQKLSVQAPPGSAAVGVKGLRSFVTDNRRANVVIILNSSRRLRPKMNGDKLSDMLEVYVCTKLSDPEINTRRYRRGMTISDLKNKLEMITGRSASTMMLSAYDKNKLVAKLDDDDLQLGSYPVENGMFVLVDDPAFETFDQDAVDSYKLTEEEYDAKQVRRMAITTVYARRR